mmetsp:Transcript_35772/g.93587  ORF Transcript_35772/g.93587 Transcript_35772/m.93587 type:complete len:393 (+) Transcript_35772:84-1262(+)
MVRNDYSSGRQATGEGGWSDNKPQDHEDLGSKPYKLHCNPDTMGMNPLLIANIKASTYFKNLKEFTTFEAVVDEIYENVEYCTPWEHGTHSAGSRSGLNSAVRGVGTQGRPTTAFALLAKMFTLQLTGAQIRTLIEHSDSPYIRAIGFLYIRFCCKADDLWKWMGKYVLDDEPITVQKMDDSPITMGKFVRILLTEHDYYGTHMPRISVHAAKELQGNLEATMAEAVAGGYAEPVLSAESGHAADGVEAAEAGPAAAGSAASPPRRDDRKDDYDRRRYDDRDRDDRRDRERSRERDDRRDRDRGRDRYDYDGRRRYDRRDDYDRHRRSDRSRRDDDHYSRSRDRDRDRSRDHDYDYRDRYGGDDRYERRRREEREEEYYREKRRERSPVRRE